MPRIKTASRKRAWYSINPWGVVILVFFALAAQTYYVHIKPDPRILTQSQKQYWAQVPVSTSRGDILDRNGIPLAISVPVTSLYIDPQSWLPENASALEPYLGKKVKDKFSRPLPGRFHWVARKVPNDIAMPILGRNIEGLFSVRENQRQYPHASLGSHVLGYCDVDDMGLAGVEMAWNNILYSPPQTRLLIRDAKGKMLDLIGSNAGVLDRGQSDIRLTIDSRFQQVVEWKLKDGIESTQSKWGAVVCVNPNNGEIIAMASYPTINPNDRSSFNKNREALRNNAISRVYEPGSTFKPIIMGIALDMGITSLSHTFNCTGTVKIADGIIRNFNSRGHGLETTETTLIKSCNVGMALIGNRFEKHRTYSMLRQFGFGEKTDIEIAGEEEGLLRTPEKWLGMVPANLAIGQGIAVTPLQLAMGISAIANGGTLLKPYLVAEVKDSKGNIVHRGTKRVRASVLTAGVSDWLRKTLRKTVIEGTGKGADTSLAEIAGKTGTAQIATKGAYVKGQYVSSFVGFWPYKNPKYVLLVVLGEPKGAKYYGGEIAAPVFKTIVEDLVQIGSNPSS